MNAIILGAGSDIAKHIASRLVEDGWTLEVGGWDLLLCAMGTLKPIGKFSEIEPVKWSEGVWGNALLPLHMLHQYLPDRNENSSAVFFSGTNPAKTNPGYSAYSSAKALLVRAVEEIDAEMPDMKLFTIAPGFIRTKIHDVAGHDVSQRHDKNTKEDVYQCLKSCIAKPKIEVGGKVIVV